ncbi:methylated-DNA--[protein]-cysteine S-methyltransferase [Ignatzschineria sp. LJL83]
MPNTIQDAGSKPAYFYYHSFKNGEIGFLFDEDGLIEMDISGMNKEAESARIEASKWEKWEKWATEITDLSQLSKLDTLLVETLPALGELHKFPSKRIAVEALLNRIIAEFTAYFSGNLKDFTIPMKPQGTPFQRSVWKALTEIPYGAVISYKTLAENIENPKAVRAVGSANGKNPLPIIIPCHRVIQANQTLGGYSGGLSTKIALLTLEGFSFSSEKSGLKVVLGQSALNLE